MAENRFAKYLQRPPETAGSFVVGNVPAVPGPVPAFDPAPIGVTNEGRLMMPNPNGTHSTEVSATIKDPRLNNGAPTNIPTYFNGRPVPVEEAIERVVQAGGVDPETGRRLPGYADTDEIGRMTISRASPVIQDAIGRSQSLANQQRFVTGNIPATENRFAKYAQPDPYTVEPTFVDSAPPARPAPAPGQPPQVSTFWPVPQTDQPIVPPAAMDPGAPMRDDADPTSEFGKGWRQGVEGLKATTQSLGAWWQSSNSAHLNRQLESLDAVDRGEHPVDSRTGGLTPIGIAYRQADEAGRRQIRGKLIGDIASSDEAKQAFQESWKQYSEEAARHTGRVPRLEDINDFNDFLDFASNAFGQAGPSMAAVLTAVAAGTAIGGPAGGAVAGFGAGYGLGTGEMHGALLEEGIDDPDLAGKAGLVSGALEAVPGPAGRLVRNAITQAAAKRYAQTQARNYAQRLGRELAPNIGEEAIAEGLQQAWQNAVVAGVTDQEFWTDENVSEIINAMAVGAAGGTMGAPVAAIPGGQPQAVEAPSAGQVESGPSAEAPSAAQEPAPVAPPTPGSAPQTYAVGDTVQINEPGGPSHGAVGTVVNAGTPDSPGVEIEVNGERRLVGKALLRPARPAPQPPIPQARPQQEAAPAQSEAASSGANQNPNPLQNREIAPTPAPQTAPPRPGLFPIFDQDAQGNINEDVQVGWFDPATQEQVPLNAPEATPAAGPDLSDLEALREQMNTRRAELGLPPLVEAESGAYEADMAQARETARQRDESQPARPVPETTADISSVVPPQARTQTPPTPDAPSPASVQAETPRSGAQREFDERFRVPRAPQSLTDFIRARGGIRATDQNIGDIRAIADKGAFRLLSRKGVPLDEMREYAAEAGFLPGDSTNADFLALLDQDVAARGDARMARVYSDLDESVPAYQQAAQTRADAERAFADVDLDRFSSLELAEAYLGTVDDMRAAIDDAEARLDAIEAEVDRQERLAIQQEGDYLGTDDTALDDIPFDFATEPGGEGDAIASALGGVEATEGGRAEPGRTGDPGSRNRVAGSGGQAAASAAIPEGVTYRSILEAQQRQAEIAAQFEVMAQRAVELGIINEADIQAGTPATAQDTGYRTEPAGDDAAGGTSGVRATETGDARGQPRAGEGRTPRPTGPDDSVAPRDGDAGARDDGDGVRRGEIGMMVAAGEVVLTSTGRETTPFPSTKAGKVPKDTRKVDTWLMQNALDEARARGDDFNARQFEANINRPSQADKDSAEFYLFDPDFVQSVPRPILKDLSAPEPRTERTDQGDNFVLGEEIAPEITDDSRQQARQDSARRDAENEAQVRQQQSKLRRGGQESVEGLGLFDTQGDLLSQSAAETKPDEKIKAADRSSASWVIRNKETGEVVMETFDRAKVDALNTDKYEAVPAGEHLASLNRRGEVAAADLVSPQPATESEQSLLDAGGAWWAGLSSEQRLEASAKAGWVTNTGKPNFVARRHAKTEWPEIPEESRRTLARKNNIGATPETPAPEAGVSDSGPMTLDGYIDTRNAINDGTIAPAEFRAAFARFREGEQQIKSDLDAKYKGTKGMMVLRSLSPRGRRKAEMIDDAYNQFAMQFYPGDGISYSPMQETMMQAIERKIERASDQEIADYIRDRAESVKASREKRDAIKRGMDDPQTLDDFWNLIDRRGQKAFEALSDEKKALFDDLQAQRTRERQQADAAKKAEVKAVKSDAAPGDIVETKHTQKGHDLFVVQLSDRVDKETYKDLLARAKQLGGYYSKYRANGAVPGFQFRTRDAAEQFQKVARGETVSRAETVEAKAETRKASAADKMRDMANRMIEKADASLSQDRRTGTARQARMAAGAEDDARYAKQIAQTLLNIADALDDGRAKNLEGIRDRTQVEMLDRMLRQAVYEADRGLSYAEQEKRKGRPVEDSDIQQATFPVPNAHREQVMSLAKSAEDIPGVKRAAANLMKRAMAAAKADEWRVDFTQPFGPGQTEDVQAVIAAVKKKKAGTSAEWDAKNVEDGFTTPKRLERAGITDTPSLRAALREFNKLRAKRETADPVVQMERAMIGRKIDGYFPTPRPLVDEIIEKADITEGQTVLEPSAGKGNIADALRDAGAEVSVIEVNTDLRAILDAKKHQVLDDRDFLEHQGQYDRIVMNPPFENGQDIDHVRHAYDLLKPGGRLVAITSEGPFFRQDKKATEFREWVDSLDGVSEQNPDGSFKTSERPTGVATRTVVIDKPSGEGDLQAASVTDTPAFKRWFGDSKVVDENGKPLVVYHGTPDARGLLDGGAFEARIGSDGAFFFTNSRAVARTYADPKRAFDYQGARPAVGKLYLSIQNPMIIDARGASWGERGGPQSQGEQIARARAKGHDGIIIRNTLDTYNVDGNTRADVFVAFDPKQIKSAEGGPVIDLYDRTEIEGSGPNRGTFDASDPRITYRTPIDNRAYGNTPRELTPDGEKAADAALKVLNRIAPDAPVDLYQDITDADGNVLAFGVYIDGIISLALNSPDVTGTARHEAIHFLRAIGAIKPNQWNALAAAARKGNWITKHGIDKRPAYANLSEDKQLEEAIAEEYAQRMSGKPGGTQVDRVFAYLRRVFEQIRTAIREVLGFEPDAGDLFVQIETGRTARGERVRRIRPQEGMARYQGGAVTDTPAFKRWFGDSKVVDENGEPLRVYHGTGAEFEAFDRTIPSKHIKLPGFFFTPDPQIASWFAESASRSGEWRDPDGYIEGYQGANILPVYLSIKNPAEIDLSARMYSGAEVREMLTDAQKKGHDGAVLRGWADGSGPIQYVAFRPEQIKSATGNRGTFDASDPRISYQAPTEDQQAALGQKYRGDTPSPTGPRDPYRAKPEQGQLAELPIGIQPRPWYETVQEYMQDKMVRWKTVQNAVEKTRGSKLDESENVYLQEELYIGRAGERLDELTKIHLKPIAEAIADSDLRDATVAIPDGEGGTMEVTGGGILEAYLYAMHAPERNAQIAKINPDFEEGAGSGMTDADAAATLAAIDDAGLTEAARPIAQMVRDMLDESIDTRVAGGLMSEQQAAKWRDTYQHYVPLRGVQNEEADEHVLPRSGKGYNVRGPESKRALGRRSRAEDILGHAFVMGQESIIRAEKNRVFQTLLNLVTKNPDPAVWEVNKVRMAYALNKSTGQVEFKPVNALTLAEADHTIRGKVNGQEVRILVHDPYLARSLQSMGAENFGFVTWALMPISRMLSSLNTSYNPEFVITNAIRDIQTAGVNLQQYDMKGITADVLKNWRRGLVAVLDEQDMKRLAGTTGAGLSQEMRARWQSVYQQYKKAGGKVSFWKIGELSDHVARINDIMRDADPSLGRALVNEGKAVVDWIEKANIAVDNAVRLAAFKAAVDRGMSEAQAASLAKNLTVNFNRKGWAGPAMNSLYMFFNAGIQGTAILFSAMKHKRVRKVVGGIVVAGMMAEMLNAALSPEDDDGEILYDKLGGSTESADFLKSRNLIIMDPFGLSEDGYWSLPLAYGYNVFWDLGRNAAAYMRGGQSGGRALANMLQTTVDMFNPIGTGQNLLTTIAPTVIKPGVELALNENFMGGPIYPEGSPFDTAPKPASAQPWRNTSTISAETAEWLNSMTGGDKIRPGEIDLAPQGIDHVASFFTGAAGRFWGQLLNESVDRAAAVWKGQPQPELELRDVPFARKVYRVKPEYRDRSDTYDAIRDVYGADLRLRNYRKAGDAKGAKAFQDERNHVIRLKPYAKKIRKTLREIRAQRDKLETQGISRDDKRFERLDQQEAKAIGGFLKAYRAAVEKEKDRGNVLTSTTKRKRIVQDTMRDAASAFAN